MATDKPQTTAKTPVGGYVLSDKPIEINAGRPTVKIKVRNTGDRPIQVGSHFHFFEVNRALEFDREAAFGKRLDIPASTAMRFEPGDEKEVTLVPFGGKQRINGFNNLVESWTGTGPTPGLPAESQQSRIGTRRANLASSPKRKTHNEITR